MWLNKPSLWLKPCLWTGELSLEVFNDFVKSGSEHLVSFGDTELGLSIITNDKFSFLLLSIPVRLVEIWSEISFFSSFITGFNNGDETWDEGPLFSFLITEFNLGEIWNEEVSFFSSFTSDFNIDEICEESSFFSSFISEFNLEDIWNKVSLFSSFISEFDLFNVEVLLFPTYEMIVEESEYNDGVAELFDTTLLLFTIVLKVSDILEYLETGERYWSFEGLDCTIKLLLWLILLITFNELLFSIVELLLLTEILADCPIGVIAVLVVASEVDVATEVADISDKLLNLFTNVYWELVFI